MPGCQRLGGARGCRLEIERGFEGGTVVVDVHIAAHRSRAPLQPEQTEQTDGDAVEENTCHHVHLRGRYLYTGTTEIPGGDTQWWLIKIFPDGVTSLILKAWLIAESIHARTGEVPSDRRNGAEALNRWGRPLTSTLKPKGLW